MKEYPSIPRDIQEFPAYVFDKLDGSNVRVQYSQKQGWYKFGKRHGLIDASDPVLGQAVDVFRRDWGEILQKHAEDSKWRDALLFFEFHGPNSFAGCHESSDPKTLTLIDAALHKQGLMPPNEFLKEFDGMNHAAYLGHFKWTRSFVEQVRNNEIPGITFEGVVGKYAERHKIIMRKAKTAQWLEKVKNTYTDNDAAQRIIDS